MPASSTIQGKGYRRGMLIEAGKRAIEHAVRLWHRQFRPLHFSEGASRRYGYAKRQGSGQPEWIRTKDGRTVRNRAYIWRKKRVKGHTRPLVWSGESLAASGHARFSGQVRGDALVGQATMSMPSHFFLHPKQKANGQFIDKPAELLKVRDDEMRVLRESVRREFLRQVRFLSK